MVIPWTVPWIEMHTDERFLRTATESRWGLIETEGDIAVMAENEAEQPVSEDTGYLILPESGNTRPSVAMGDDDKVVLDQVVELRDLLRDFARTCNPNQSKVYYDVNKAFFRCIEQLNRCLDEHRRA